MCALETDADRLEILQDDGEAAVWTPAGGSAVSVDKVLFDAPFVAANPGADVNLEGVRNMAVARETDLGNAAKGDALSRTSTAQTFTVRFVGHCGPGWVFLVLEEQP